MSLNESNGVKASFQLVPAERYSTSLDLIQEIRQRGHEVNIHDWNHDGRLFSDRSTFLNRVTKINEAARQYGAEGFRSGALYRNLDWYNEFSLSYDMSVPNVGHLDPQPGGCCTVMPYFVGKILELPVTTTQDYMLFHLLGHYSLDLWKQQLDLIFAKHGLASFIVHPDYIVEPKAQQTYRKLLEHLRELQSARNIWLALPGEANQWWRKRSQMNLVRKADGWTIEGPGCDDARIAWASLDNFQLTYSFADN